MINVRDYILLVLEKKKWNKTRFCQEINKIESLLGDKRTTVQNIANYFDGTWPFRPKILAKWETALDLPRGTLINMVSQPICKESKLELANVIKKIDDRKKVKYENNACKK